MHTRDLSVSLLLLPLSLALAGCSKPAIEVLPPVSIIGQATPLTVHVHDAHGVSKLTATVSQNGSRYTAWQGTPASVTRAAK